MNKQCIDTGKVFADSLPKGSKVLDCGSLDVNGSFRESFSDHEYIGSDISPGRNVDIVQPDPFTLPFPDCNFDAVISGNMLEHSANPFRIFAEMVRVLKPGGRICIMVPWLMAYHAYPEDCWRISPDGMRHLCDGLPIRIIANGFENLYYPHEQGTLFFGERI